VSVSQRSQAGENKASGLNADSFFGDLSSPIIFHTGKPASRFLGKNSVRFDGFYFSQAD